MNKDSSLQSKQSLILQYFKIAQEKASEGHLSIIRQFFEMLLLFVYRGLGPGYYLLSRFWRREIQLGDKLRHLNERDYSRKVAEFNNPYYQKLSQNKVAEKAMLSLFGLLTPSFLGHLHSERGRSFCNEPLCDATQLARLLEMKRPARICFKLVEGWSGSGFEAADVDYSVSPPCLIPFPKGQSLDLETYLNKRLKKTLNSINRIVEEYCYQHSWYQSLNSTSLNTIRIYLFLPDNKPVRILGGYLRIGRAGSITDNASTGGLMCPINMESGELEAGRLDIINSPYFTKHPDSGAALEGCILPGWAEIKALLPKVLEIFPNIRFAGVDIAMTESGPSVIELNVEPDRTSSCDLDIPTLNMFTDGEGN